MKKESEKGRHKIAVVGATGAVGRVMFSILAERGFPVSELVALASLRSEGRKLAFHGKEVVCRKLAPGCFDGVKIAFFDASDAVSKEWVPLAAEAGAWVVDNSAAFRMDADVPLIVPEVNGQALEAVASLGAAARGVRGRIVAGPNCTTAQLVVALKPLHDRFGLKRVVVSSYQSVSGAGTAAMQELSAQTAAVLDGRAFEPKVLAHPIAFNCIPKIGSSLDAEGYTGEERKIIVETRKILGLPALRVTATCVRVPTLACHGESVNVELERACSVEAAREALAAQEGVVVQDDAAHGIYPMGVDAAGHDPVYVGRIRHDSSVENGLNLWVVSDNLRKGAALNAIQIGEALLAHL